MNRLAKASGFAVAALALATGIGCTGQVGENGVPGRGPGEPGGNGNNPSPGAPGAPTPVPPVIMPGPDGVVDSAGPHALRRLTVLEYSNTVRDLLGVNLSDSDRRGFSADQVVAGGFASGAAITTSVDSRQFLDVSARVAAAATADLAKLMPAGCAAPAAGAEKGCIDRFLEQFAPRAFRRPLTTEETSGFAQLFTKIRAADVGATFGEAVHDVLLAILQSPEFLYRWELHGQPIKDGALTRFGDYEVASRLSYFLWSSMPDEELFKAAAAGQLQRPDQIAGQAQRLLKDKRATDGLRDFHLQWLGIYGVDEIEKGDIYKTYSPEVAKAMLAETAAFVEANLFSPSATGKLEDLLTSSTSYVNGLLATHYGVPGITGDALQKVELPNRAGILTQGSFLTKHSKEVESFPIIRGVYVLRNVLCQDIPEPQIELPPAPEQKQGQTTRQLYADFTAAAACQACHARINAVGFALENYDATGRYRTNEEGQTVDSSGTLELPSGPITFKNGIEFLKAAAKTPEARECVARNWMRALLRREERPDEGGSLKAARGAFEASGFDLRSLIVEITKTRVFTHHNPMAGK